MAPSIYIFFCYRRMEVLAAFIVWLFDGKSTTLKTEEPRFWFARIL